MIRDVGSVVDHVIELAELRAQYPESGGYETGWRAWDNNLRDAMLPGRLIVLAAPSGGGKTAAAAQLAIALAHQVPVLHSSLEDAPESVGERYLANVGRLDVGSIRRGFDGQQVPPDLRQAGQKIQALPVSLNCAGGSVEELCGTMQSWMIGNGYTEAVWIIDQLSHIRKSDPQSKWWRSEAGSDYERPSATFSAHDQLEWTVAHLRTFAARHKVLVVLVHQVNGQRADTGQLMQGSIRGSQGIVHKADTVVAFDRPDLIRNPFPAPGSPTWIPNTSDQAMLTILKGREVQTKSVEISWNGPEQRWDDPNATQSPYRAARPPTARAIEGRNRVWATIDGFHNEATDEGAHRKSEAEGFDSDENDGKPPSSSDVSDRTRYQHEITGER